MRDRSSILIRMNQLSTSDRASVVSALVEGNSIRATVRMTGVAKNTIAKLLVDMGTACESWTRIGIRDVPAKQIQVDEIWAFCYAKQRNLPEHLQGKFGYGDVWTWVAIDADTKLVIAWHVGPHNGDVAYRFLTKLAKRVSGRPQVNTDGFQGYQFFVAQAFKGRVDHAIVSKVYGSPLPTGPDTRYSPPECIGQTKTAKFGKPDLGRASTTFIERHNLTTRMSVRRFTRLTNGFSKKVQNHAAAVAMHFTYYNLCRPHASLNGMTPAQAAGLTDHRWSVSELVDLIDLDIPQASPACG